MKFITGQNREQIHLFPLSVDASIGTNNEVRMIDLFVDALKLSAYGFRTDFIENGRPAYHPSDLLKLYIYGYLNKIRSSRDLEKECKRNIEVMWLLQMLQPDHNTISNFRKDNAKAIKKVFRATVQIAKHFDLIGGKLIAGDSSKLRAQNSKKNNYNQKKIEHHIAYIEAKVDEYNQALSTADGDEKQELQKQIQTQLERKGKYEDISKQLEETGEVQLSASDPESRQIITRNNITEVAYNVQTTVDEKHNIPIDYKVTNENDSKAMGNMARRAKSILRTNDFTLLCDKGYHTGSELKTVQCLGIESVVAIPAVPSSSMAPDPAYNLSAFTYNPKVNTYTCPQGNTMITNGTWYKKGRSSKLRKRGDSIMVQHFKTTHCKSCPVINSCTKNTRGRGRVIERTACASYIEQNRKNVEQKEHLYKRRQAIVEHPYGTIKRQWGFYYILTKKGMQRASADVGFMFIAYNLRRIINILGQKVLAKYFQVLCPFILLLSHLIKHKTGHFKLSDFFIQNNSSFIPICCKRFIFDENLMQNRGF